MNRMVGGGLGEWNDRRFFGIPQAPAPLGLYGYAQTMPQQVVAGALSRFEYNEKGALLTPYYPELENYTALSNAVALDCEMVGVGPNGKKSALARVSIVNEHGFAGYDKFVQPPVPVTDYRTDRSGIREEDLFGAWPACVVAQEVADILNGRTLIGHSLEHDLTALGLEQWFPHEFVRDTAIYFTQGPQQQRPKLKDLVSEFFGISIQDGEHCSIIDAQAAMALYRMHRRDWEASRRAVDEETWILRMRLDTVYRSRKFSLP